MPYYKRFYPAPSASAAIKRDVQQANKILEILEDSRIFDSSPDWLKELQDPTQNPKEGRKVAEKVERLKALAAKLMLAGVGFEPEEGTEFAHITNALKLAYPSGVVSGLFENTPLLKHLKTPKGY